MQEYAGEIFTALTKAEHILLHFQKEQRSQNFHMELQIKSLYRDT